MPTYWIHSCRQSSFDAYEFVVGEKKSERVEGQMWKINYYPQAAQAQKPSELQIRRNFENAVQKQGGAVVWSDKIRLTLKLAKDDKEIWAELRTEFTGKYFLTIVQKEAMAQDIVADAKFLSDGLGATGHVAVYGILFDTDKAAIKPESEPALQEIAKLLQQNPSLNVFVVGHTDSTGDFAHNMSLSEARAKAVVAALTAEHGVAASRLSAYGCGPLAPVASNDTDEGKAKNRRVELVKR
jgi:outer membrane protein OmpA-like peptidoglycan-associated protein